jgi:hypothetical protein
MRAPKGANKRKSIRQNKLKHYESTVEATARKLNLDPTSASDRELLLRILSEVHSPYVGNMLNKLLMAPKPPGNPNFVGKWSDPAAFLEVTRDIDAVWKACNYKKLSSPKLVDRLQERFPEKYKIERETLIKQLRELLRSLGIGHLFGPE